MRPALQGFFCGRQTLVLSWRRYGDLTQRKVRGVVLESFGVGNMPDLPAQGWLPWLKSNIKQGLKVMRAPSSVLPAKALTTEQVMSAGCISGAHGGLCSLWHPCTTHCRLLHTRSDRMLRSYLMAKPITFHALSQNTFLGVSGMFGT